jgi:hypothetical protein
MLKKDLATALGISAAMISKLAKRGMPTDTLERAERWRRRHLEPGRVKGVRYGTVSAIPRPVATRQRLGAQADRVPFATVELWSSVVRQTQSSGLDIAEMLIELRALLQRLQPGENPRMALGVWLALTDYAMSEDAELRLATDHETLLDANGFAARLTPHITNGGSFWLSGVACDREGYSVGGWPAGFEDD